MVKFRFYDPDDKKKTPMTASEAESAIQAVVSNSAPEQSPAQAAPAPSVAAPRTALASDKHRFTLDWVSELGWSGNPFTDAQPRPAHQFIVNQETARQEINLFFIKGASFGTITGEKGYGKTFILAWLAEELAQYRDKFLVYTFNSDVSIKDFSETLTKPYAKLFSKYRGKTPEELAAYISIKITQKLVILVDNADKMPELEPYLHALVTNGHAIVVIAGTKPKAFMKDELNVNLRTMFAKDALSLVEKRIANVGGTLIKPFDEKLLQELWKASQQNVPTFLRYCNDAAVKLALKQLTLPDEEKAAAEVVAEKAAEKKVKESKAKKTAKGKKETAKEESKAPAKKSPYDDFISSLEK